MTVPWCVLRDDPFKLTVPLFDMDLYLQSVEKEGEIVAISLQHPVSNPSASLLEVSDFRQGSPESIQVSIPFARDVLARLAARKYGSDKQTERRTDYLQDDDPPDFRSGLAYDRVEQRMVIDELMEQLPPKQREAAEVQLRAFQEGFSLEEMARRLGKDPKRTRENFKAAQRRTGK